jgi:hypothetical protein
MKQPEGFEEPGKERLVCRLGKALYGLKQASRQWYHELNTFLTSIGMERSQGDSTLYWIGTDDDVVILLVYVDDILVASKSEMKLNMVKGKLMNKYVMTDMGPVTLMLGIEIARTSAGMRLHQSAFTREILAEHGMLECNEARTPMRQGLQLSTPDIRISPIRQDAYRRVVGQLQYLAGGTRPDFSFCVGLLSRYCQRPIDEHWNAVKRVLRYLKGTANMGITFDANDKDKTLLGYTDADWAGDSSDRKSVSGFVFFMGGHTVSWGSKKQSCVSLSTMEAEFVALARATQEMIWLCKLAIPTVWSGGIPIVCVDNEPAQAFAEGSACSSQSKHIALRYHFVRDLAQGGDMTLKHTPTGRMVADIMTKALGFVKFDEFRYAVLQERAR